MTDAHLNAGFSERCASASPDEAARLARDALVTLTERLYHAEVLEQAYEAGLEGVLEALRCDRAAILLFDEHHVMRFVAWRDLSTDYRGAVEGHSPWSPDAADPQPVCVDDVAGANFSPTLRAVVLAEGIGALAFIPLSVKGRLIGKFMAYYNRPHAFTALEADLALAIGRQIAFSIERGRADRALRQSQSQLAAEAQCLARINLAGARLWRARELTVGLEEVLSAAIELTGADKGNVQLFSPASQALFIAVQRGFDDEFLNYFRTVSAGDPSACGQAMRANRRIIVEDVETEPECESMRPIARHAGFRAVQSTPLLSREGESLGMLSTHFTSPARPDDQCLRHLDLLAQQAADFIVRCRLDQSLADAQAMERARAEELARERELLQAIIDRIPVMITLYDPQTKVLRVNPEFERVVGWSAADAAGVSLMEECYPDPAYREDVARFMAECGDGWKDIRMRTRSDAGIETMWANVRLSDDTRVGFGLNITDRKRSEQQRVLLINELNHRVKNTLTTVQSLAVQTLRNADGDKDALRRFESRLAALARAHDLLTHENMEGADLRSTVERALEPFRGDPERITWNGPAARLSAKQALALSLALHELATNATKYGALSAVKGHVELVWANVESPEPLWVLTWSEHDGPPVSTPNRQGFGSRLITRSLEHDLGAKAEVQFRTEGVVAVIRTPIEPLMATTS